MIRAFRYPLHPTAAQEATLLAWLRACCSLYNGALQERRDAWGKLSKSITFNDQTRSLTEIRREDPEWTAIPVEVARSALRRLDRAMRAFFARAKRGQIPGFPRFRSSQRYDSFSYPTRMSSSLVAGSGRSARIRLPKLGAVKINLYRPLKGDTSRGSRSAGGRSLVRSSDLRPRRRSFAPCN